MNKQFFLFLLLIPFLGFSQIQSGTVIYKVTPTSDYLHWKDSILNDLGNDLVAKTVRQTFDKSEKATPFLEFHLDFNHKESTFDRPPSMGSDGGMDLNMMAGMVGVDGKYYVDIEKRFLLNQFEDPDGFLIVQSSLDNLEWAISNETKNIQGYECRKATTTIDLNTRKKGKITAWFTTELPFQFGPLEFAGLPGLILGLERNHRYFYADEIKLSEQQKSIKKPDKGKLLSKEEYFQEIKDWEKKKGLD